MMFWPMGAMALMYLDVTVAGSEGVKAKLSR